MKSIPEQALATGEQSHLQRRSLAREHPWTGPTAIVQRYVLEQAEPDEMHTCAAVLSLVASSGIEFGVRGKRELNGVPGTWKLFAVKD